MKKIVPVLLLILLILLSSCSSTKKTTEEAAPEVVESVVIETPPTEVKPVVTEEEKPQEAEAEPEEKPEVVVEQVIVGPEVGELEIKEVTPEEAVETLSETDWSYVFTAPEEGSEEVAPIVEVIVKTPQDAPVVEEKPAAPQKTTTTAPATVSATTSSASSAAEDKGPSIFTEIGNFIISEKLLSTGLLVCFVGIIFLIVVLIRTSEARKRHLIRKEAKAIIKRDEEAARAAAEASREEETKVETASEGKPSEPEDEDDEFLRALLGDDK